MSISASPPTSRKSWDGSPEAALTHSMWCRLALSRRSFHTHPRLRCKAEAARDLHGVGRSYRRSWRPDVLRGDNIEMYRRAAGYVHRILNGEKPAELPVQAAEKFELAVNL